MSAVEPAQPEEQRLLLGEHDGVQQLIELFPVARIEVGVGDHRPESRRRMTVFYDQFVDQRSCGRIALEGGQVAEQRDRVVVEDPVVLGPDEARHRRRWRAGENALAIAPHGFEVREEPLVFARLFDHVLLEIRGERRRH